MLSFGGPAAQIALMHKELVDERAWISEQRFLSALSFCMLLPGPEAMQMATFSGWRLRGVAGGVIAGGLFVLPRRLRDHRFGLDLRLFRHSAIGSIGVPGRQSCCGSDRGASPAEAEPQSLAQPV